jgi:hypothetical protein
MNKYQLVKITWKDAFAGPQEWCSVDDYETKPVIPLTVGWLIPDMLDGYVTTADTYYIDEDGDVLLYNIGHIPDEMVISIEVLEKHDKITRRASKRGDK